MWRKRVAGGMPLKWLAWPWLLLSQFSVCHELSHPAPPQCALRCTVHKQQPRDGRYTEASEIKRQKKSSLWFLWLFVLF